MQKLVWVNHLVCVENLRDACLDSAQVPWQETIQAAENHYDRSDNCLFTSFVGYEWTGAAYSGNNLHQKYYF